MGFGEPNEVSPEKRDIRRENFDGPVKSRSCTDVICFLFFFCVLISLIALIIYATTAADIDGLVRGRDRYGNICGRKNEPIKDVPNSGQDKTNFPNVIVCPISITGCFEDCVAQCPPKTMLVLHKCLPLPPATGNMSLESFPKTVANDLRISWRKIIYLCLIALGLSIVVTLLFRFFARIIIWLAIFVVVIACVGGTTTLWVMYYYSKIDRGLGESDRFLATLIKENTQSFLFAAIAATVITVIILLILLVLRKRIGLVISLFGEAGRALQAMPLLLLQPVITFVAVIFFVSIAVVAGFYFLAATQSVVRAISFDSSYRYDPKDWLLYMQVYNLFVLLWTSQFCISCQHLVLAGAISFWFFCRDKKNLGFPILFGWKMAVRYHLGSVAFGSILIALFRFIRIILQLFKDKGGEIFHRCCQCCLACIQAIITFVSRNAFIEMAIYGESFCSSAKRAINVLGSNMLRVSALNSIGDFVIFLGKASVVISVIFIGLAILKEEVGLVYIWVPLTIAAIASYLIASCFLAVFEMAIDTLFICFCEDCEINDGVERPYYMSVHLMKFVKNSSQAIELTKKREALEKHTDMIVPMGYPPTISGSIPSVVAPMTPPYRDGAPSPSSQAVPDVN